MANVSAATARGLGVDVVDVTATSTTEASSSFPAFTNATTDINGSANVTEATPILSPADQDTLMLTRFVLYGILGNVLVVMGLLGNTLSIVVLCNRRMRSSTSFYLTSLGVYDNFILLSMLLFFNLPALGAMMPSAMAGYNYAVLLPVGYPLSLAAQMGSIYTCVAFTVERYVAVCRPLHAANTCTKTRAKRAILLILLWSLVYNIPRCFHYAARRVYNEHSRQHETHVVVTEFGKNEVFQHVYIIYFQLLFMFLLPFLVILLLNAALIRAISRSRHQRQRMSTSATREHNLTVMLVAVIVVFLVCQFPTIVDNILVAVVGEERHNVVLQYQLLYIACTCLVTINSSLNFVLYCLFGKKFRLVLCHILGVRTGVRDKNGHYRSTICHSKANGVKPSQSATYHMDVSLV